MNFDTISELDLKDFFANDNKRAFALDLLRGVDTGIRDFNVVEYKDTRGNEGLDATFDIPDTILRRLKKKGMSLSTLIPTNRRVLVNSYI